MQGRDEEKDFQSELISYFLSICVLVFLFLSHLAINLILILRDFLNNKYLIHFGNEFLLPYNT